MELLPRLEIVQAVENLLRNISSGNGFYCDYQEIKHADQIPTEYGFNGLYWEDGKAEGEYVKTQKTKLWIEIDGILVETTDRPAHSWGTLALADLERAFKSIGGCGAISTQFKSDKWLATKGKTVARVHFSVCIEYINRFE